MRRHRLVALAALFLCSATAAAAQPTEAVDPTLDDFRCALAGMLTSSDPDKEKQDFGTMLAVYFMGRMDGREPDFDGQLHLDKQFGDLLKLDPNELTKATKGCFQKFAESQARMGEWANK